MLFQTAARILKIPSRITLGIIHGTILQGHSTAEIYSEHLNEWISLEANEFYGVMANYIQFSDSEDESMLVRTIHLHNSPHIYKYSYEYPVEGKPIVY